MSFGSSYYWGPMVGRMYVFVAMHNRHDAITSRNIRDAHLIWNFSSMNSSTIGAEISVHLLRDFPCNRFGYDHAVVGAVERIGSA